MLDYTFIKFIFYTYIFLSYYA